jgi:competence CoiA-like predicted nuclease
MMNQAIYDALATIGATIVVRWLLGISSYKEDMKWLKLQLLHFRSLDTYRGNEYIHQLRARRLLA